jgi:CRISPR-associated protein Cas2
MIVTRDVADRFRGFLSSVMLEVAPGVFVSPRMSKGVRDRVWGVLTDWHQTLCCGSIVMAWRDQKETGGIGLAHLGTRPRELVEVDGMWLTRRSKPQNAL